MDEQEAQTVQYLYNLYEEQASTSKVAHQLNAEQVKTKRGGKWTAKTINDVLRNPFYIGTYRYNVKNNKRRLKDKKEWVVVENNHPAIISVEQFNKVNKMLSDNYRGNGEFQRANANTHIFSKMLICGKCGSSFNAGLDRARKDGYRPSRYTCYGAKYSDNLSNCNNFVSDVTLLPFIINYISNFINLQNKITTRHSLRDIEKILLRGNAFVDVECIDKKGLRETYIAFTFGFSGESFDDNSVLRDIIQTIISELTIVDKKVYSITFLNGIVHNFMYKPKERQLIPTKEKFLYRTYETKIVEYLQENESISRKYVEELTGIGRNGAGSIINELLSNDIITKTGNSVATRYFLTKKTTK